MANSLFRTVAMTIGAQLAAVTVCSFLFIYSGLYNLAATAPHTPPVKWIMTAVRTHSIEAHARKNVIPQDFSSINPADGFAEYDEMCASSVTARRE